MQFVCDQCKTKYDIDEGRVRGKALKIRCRSCGNVIEVRDPGPAKKGADPSAKAPPPPPSSRKPGGGKAEPAAGGSLGARFQKAFESHGAAGTGRPEPEEATHIMVSPMLAGDKGPPSDVTRKLARWHVAIRNQPMGPMSEESIRRHIEDGAVHGGSLVWREGFDEWKPLSAVRELGYLLETPGASGAPRESLFDLPPLQSRSIMLTGAPPPPAAHSYLLNGIVAVVAFSLGMLFMYVIGSRGGAGAPAPQMPAGGAPIPGTVDDGTGVQGGLPTLHSGSLTITLTNPTLLAEPTSGAAAGTPGSTSGRSGGRTGGRSAGNGTQPGGNGTKTSPAPYVPGQDLGPAGGTIRTGGGPAPIAIGGGGPRPLSGEQILPVVQAGQGGIQVCYNQARARDFVADLSMRLTIQISPDGSVADVNLSSDDYVTSELNDCIVGRVQRWQFPRASAASRVVLPFAFHQR